MARYFPCLGQRVEVLYRAGDVQLSAKAKLVADSGKSVFLEEHYDLHGSIKTFRWEIPYRCITRVREVEPPSESAQSSVCQQCNPAEESSRAAGDRLKHQPEQA